MAAGPSSSSVTWARVKTGGGPSDEAPPPYAPPVAHPATAAVAPVTYVVARNNRTYVLTPDMVVVDASAVSAGAFRSGRSVLCRCPYCHCLVETAVMRTGCGPWVWLWVLLFLLIFWPLFWVPLLFAFGGDLVHYCPLCDNVIARVAD
jgi:hypothetical protein